MKQADATATRIHTLALILAGRDDLDSDGYSQLLSYLIVNIPDQIYSGR